MISDSRAPLSLAAASGSRIELLGVEVTRDKVRARGEIIDAGEQPFALTNDWVLDSAWQSRRLHLHLRSSAVRGLVIERTGKASWRVGGHERPDLSGCDEIDLSATPFCNTLALRRFGRPPGGAGEMMALFVAFPALQLAPSRQRYEQAAPHEFVYFDLGCYAGFQASILVDEDDFVRRYEDLFERISGPLPASDPSPRQPRV